MSRRFCETSEFAGQPDDQYLARVSHVSPHIFRNREPSSTIQSISPRRGSVSAASTPFLTSPSSALFQQRRVDALVSFQKAAQQITNILELDELLEFIVHRVAVDFGCVESSILLIENDQFHLAAVHGCTVSK